MVGKEQELSNKKKKKHHYNNYSGAKTSAGLKLQMGNQSSISIKIQLI